MNYRRDEQNFISVQEILDDYVNNSSKKENFPLQEDRVKWEALLAFTKEFDWLLSSSSDDFFEWIKVQSQDLCEGS